MVDALKMMDEMLKDDNGTHPVYIANAMSHISKASDSLYKAARDVEAKTQRGVNELQHTKPKSRN